MKSSCGYLLLAAFAASFSFAQQGSAALSDPFKESGSAAFDAIVLVPYLSASEAEYQPRYFEAQKLLAAAKRKLATANDRSAYEVLEAWLSLRALAFQDDRAHDTNSLERDAKGQTQCTYEAASYFDPMPVKERFKKASEDALRTRTCVSRYNEIVKLIESKTGGAQ